MQTESLFSVGHSNHEPDHFLRLLCRAGVTAVADVRSSPYSRRLPHFARPHLEALLQENGIAYQFLGDSLGGRPADEDLYDAEGRVDYERVRATGEFRRGLERLLGELERFAVAMMCSEEDPLDCHRGLMITPALRECGLAPLHLRKHGVETTEQMEERLMRETKLADEVGGLFPRARDEVLAEAYRLMNRKKAFRVLREEDPFG
jgi:uncharacterized protein (DUF488 family)